MAFRSAFAAGLSVKGARLERFDGSRDLRRDFVDAIVDVEDLRDMVSFSEKVVVYGAELILRGVWGVWFVRLLKAGIVGTDCAVLYVIRVSNKVEEWMISVDVSMYRLALDAILVRCGLELA